MSPIKKKLQTHNKLNLIKTFKLDYLEQLLVLAPLAGPPFRHGGLLAHLPSAAWTTLPLTTPQDPLDRPPYLGGPFTNTIQRAGRRKTVPKTKLSFHLSCSLSNCLLPCLQEGCSLVAGVKVTGGQGIISSSYWPFPCQHFSFWPVDRVQTASAL